MTDTSKRERRKSKGKLSVLDEFSDEAGDIIFSPTLAPEQLSEIEARTRLADVPKLKPVDELHMSRLSKSETNRTNASSVLRELEEEAQGQSQVSRILDKTKSIGKEISPQVQTRNKDVMNPEQTRNKPVMDEGKTRNKDVTETRNGSYTKPETRNKPVTKPVTMSEQTRNRPVTDLSFNSSTTFQKEILSCIYHSMNSLVDKLTPPMSLAHFGSCLGKVDSKGLESLRVVTLRLEKMGLLIRAKVRNGRGGWTQYSLPQKVYSDIREFETRNEPVINPEHSRNKPVTKPVTTDLSSSSNDLYNKNTTTTEMPLEWASILIPQSVRAIGFGLPQIRQAFQNQKLSAEEVQDSINAFAFDLERGRVQAKTSPLNLLAGVLLRASNRYLSDAYLEACRAEIEQYAQKTQYATQAEELRKNKADEVRKLEWIESLSEDEKNKIAPPSQFVKPGSVAQMAILKAHFDQRADFEENNESEENQEL
jgi:hypothetical protein